MSQNSYPLPRALAAACSLALLGSSQAMAAAYKIPETSINSTALSGAYVANAHGADASYYNPAAMAFNEDRGQIEADLTMVHLTGISVDSNGFGLFGPFSEESEKETFLIPSFHYSSPALGNARFGLSVVTPAGLSKRWQSGVPSFFAEEFTLQTVEINPSFGYKVNDYFAIGGGLRAVYSKGIVRSAEWLLPSRLMKGDSWDFGYNLALHFKPTENLDLSATYRSKIDLTEQGNVIMAAGGGAVTVYSGKAGVTVPIPAAINLAAAYTFNDTTLELVYEKTEWSAYKELDFTYPAGAIVPAPFDDPIAKNYKDSDTFRIGITHQLNDKWTLMAGFAIDETPTPKETAGFELPDSDAKIFSVGAKYQLSDALTVGAGLLYDKKDELVLAPFENTGSAGSLAGGATFKDASAYLLTLGLQYTF